MVYCLGEMAKSEGFSKRIWPILVRPSFDCVGSRKITTITQTRNYSLWRMLPKITVDQSVREFSIDPKPQSEIHNLIDKYITDNVKKWHISPIGECVTNCFYLIWTSSVICYWTDARQLGIYFTLKWKYEINGVYLYFLITKKHLKKKHEKCYWHHLKQLEVKRTNQNTRTICQELIVPLLT